MGLAESKRIAGVHHTHYRNTLVAEEHKFLHKGYLELTELESVPIVVLRIVLHHSSSAVLALSRPRQEVVVFLQWNCLLVPEHCIDHRYHNKLQ